MKRFDYFLAAMQARMYRHKNWVISAFALTQEAPDAYLQDAYPYRIVQQPTGIFYVNPANTNELVAFEDAEVGQPPFSKDEHVDLKAGQVPNLTQDVSTSYGNWLANHILLVYPFGPKIPFVLGRMHPSSLEDAILPLFEDEPETDEARQAILAKKPNTIFVEEYLKFTNAMTYISGFANLWVSAGTEKLLLPPPGLAEFKAALFKKYGIDPTQPTVDPTVLAAVAKELKQYDAEWLKGDDTLNFLISGKSFDVVRAKKFLMVGAEAGLGDGQNMELIPNSLHEGWDVEKLPAMVNNLRAGSFNRGAETMRGGEAVKWLLRASSNINVLPDDCGSKLGVKVTLTPNLRSKYLNFSALVEGGQTVKLDEETIDQYMGKALMIRSPMYCIHDHTDYCAVCVGPRLAENPTGSSSAISSFGSTIMLMFMKANHGKALLLHKYDFKARIL